MPKVIDMPMEAVEMIMCRDVWHCTPAQLREHSYEEVLLHYEMHMGYKQMEYQLKQAAEKGH